MTKDQALAFLTEAGHITNVEQLPEPYCRINFMHRGTHLSLMACENDGDYLALQCSFSLEGAINEELHVLRTIARLQDQYKVVKFSFDIIAPGVIANAEQFVPRGEGFEAIFWRSVDLVTCAAHNAARELNTTVVADSAAERFTKQLEMELQHRDGGSDDTA